MQSHEYRVVPAPRRGLKVKGARSPEARFAHAIESEMNRLAREGWEFVRSDTLPCERRKGWFGGRETVHQTLLVFRRSKVEHQRDAMPPAVAVPSPVATSSPVAVPPAVVPAPAATRAAPPIPDGTEEPLPGVLRLMEPGPGSDRSRHAAE